MIELLTPEQMAQADRFAIAAGTPGMALMERAGHAVADAAMAAILAGSRAVVVAGPGNNGGDGFVAARILRERGYGVRVLLLGAPDDLRGDAAEAARRWEGEVERAKPAAIAGADLVVDALFGAGLSRPVEGLAADLIAAINASGVPVVAVDLPSGISGATGAVMGRAVRATETVTFFRRKPGHLLLPGRLHCGSIKLADIGIPAAALEAIRPNTFANTPDLWGSVFPVPHPAAHKYARGHAVAVSGGLASTGAARLAARGALRAGAGLVTIATPRESLAVHAAGALAIMVRAIDGAVELSALLADRRINAVVLGPGGGVGTAMRGQVGAALAGDRAVVLDADALTSFEDDPEALFAAIKERGAGSTVLTPHDGEFSRLFKNTVDVIDVPYKLEKVMTAAVRAGAVVLLKGPDTAVACPHGRAAIADNAPPWLATAGSGDVLAGLIVGLLAQRMPAFEAACAGVWLHGEAGNEAGPGLISEDLPEVLPAVYRRLLAARGGCSK
jgi:ADP-dependent NAD(P)H-hydrate dehydratase / NAD(P)H-hydrate epimerase